jgi:glycosyltransferase involved in cell wall biosynthesis
MNDGYELANHPKIAVASSGLGHVARGIEAWASDLGAALAERGLPVILCKGGGTVERPFERVIPCWQRDSAKTKRLHRWLPRRFFWRIGLGSPYDIEQLTFCRRLIRVLRREKVDILHVQDPLVALLVQRARQLGMVRTSTILAHGTEEPLSFLKRIEYLQHLAPWHMEQAREAGVWKPTWTAIPNFIDISLFAPGPSEALRAELNIPKDALVVLSAAAIKRHHKRVDHVIREFGRLREAAPDLPVWLVLAGGWEKETDELIAEGQRLLGDRVRFLVRFPRQRMPDLYRAANVFCLGSLLEMMPIALLEATASGLPCLVNRQPVMEWMIGPGGEAIDMAAPGALAAALERLLRSQSERERLGSLGREHCLRNFSRDAVVDQILAYYEVVSGRSNRATVQAMVDKAEIG